MKNENGMCIVKTTAAAAAASPSQKTEIKQNKNIGYKVNKKRESKRE